MKPISTALRNWRRPTPIGTRDSSRKTDFENFWTTPSMAAVPMFERNFVLSRRQG